MKKTTKKNVKLTVSKEKQVDDLKIKGFDIQNEMDDLQYRVNEMNQRYVELQKIKNEITIKIHEIIKENSKE